MKKYSTFMLLLVVSLMVSVASVSEGDQHIEGFWQTLKNKGVKIQRTAVEVPGTNCGNEWVEFRSHCEVDSLTKFALEEARAFELKTAKMINRISDISKLLVSSFATAEKFKQLFPNERKIKVSAYAQALASIGNNPGFRPMLLKLAAGAHAQKMRDCARDMSALRASGLCSICSGRYPAYLSGDRLMISEDACNKVLSSCVDSFSWLNRFMNSMDILTTAIAQLERSQVKLINPMRAASQNIQKAIKNIRKDGIGSLLHNYQENQESESCDCGCNEDVVENLCSKIITVSKKPIYLKFTRLVMKINPKYIKIYNNKLKRGLEKKKRKSAKKAKRQVSARKAASKPRKDTARPANRPHKAVPAAKATRRAAMKQARHGLPSPRPAARPVRTQSRSSAPAYPHHAVFTAPGRHPHPHQPARHHPTSQHVSRQAHWRIQHRPAGSHSAKRPHSHAPVRRHHIVFSPVFRGFVQRHIGGRRK